MEAEEEQQGWKWIWNELYWLLELESIHPINISIVPSIASRKTFPFFPFLSKQSICLLLFWGQNENEKRL
jgi:hypothetical protein